MPASLYEALAVNPELRNQFLGDWSKAEAQYDNARQAATTYTWEPGKGMVSHFDKPSELRDTIFGPLQEKWNPDIRSPQTRYFHGPNGSIVAVNPDGSVQDIREPSEKVQTPQQINTELRTTESALESALAQQAKLMAEPITEDVIGSREERVGDESNRVQRLRERMGELKSLLKAPTLPTVSGQWQPQPSSKPVSKRIAVKGPNGQTGTVVAGTKLPPGWVMLE